jgi:acyl-CoA synthetase (AMP-forming)/AMP-acid ligase II
MKASERQRVRLTKSSTDWRDSRFVIAVLSAAGTATFMGTVVVPLTTSYLSAKVDSLTALSATAQATAEELEKTKKKLAQAEASLANAVLETPFVPGSVYPVGLDDIVLGTPIAKVYEKFPDAKIDEESGGYLSVKTKHPLFWSATYYVSKGAGDKSVSAVLFHSRPESKLTQEAIKARFTVLFGEPGAQSKGRAFWPSPTSRETIEVLMFGGYGVDPKNYRPGWTR